MNLHELYIHILLITSSYHDIHKIIMDISKNVRWIIPFKKFGMVSVKNNCMLSLHPPPQKKP